MNHRIINRILSRRIRGLLTVFLALVITGCNLSHSLATPTLTPALTQAASSPTLQPIAKAVITFQVKVPEMAGSSVVSLDILDEVTGLALNPTRYRMTAIDNQNFTIDLPFTLGSVIKYRYSRGQATPVAEYTATGQPVRYRLVAVNGPGTVSDIVSAWSDHPYSGPLGRIVGQVTDANTKTPLPNILVEAGGIQTLTTSDGSYYIEGLAPGQHHLAVYALNGAYRTNQQGAVVAANATTPANMTMVAAPQVKVTFDLTIPQEALNVPVRIAGNLSQFGNTFASLDGGVSDIATRMPVMAPGAQGKLSLTLSLPVGADLEYKYTLGDGFWNAEHIQDGRFNLRQLIVPDKDITLEDTVATWKSGSPAPVTFTVQVPDNTPATDDVSIQFNPYSWMEPIPMWSLGNNKWMYILFSPMDQINSFSYRYCRNEQCGSADDVATAGANAKGWPVKPGSIPQVFNDQVKAWYDWQPTSQSTIVAAATITPRTNAFMAGVEFQPAYDPSWQPKYLHVLQDLHNSGSNWVILSPTWTFISQNPPVLELVPGQDALWSDLVETAGQAKAVGLKTALFPQAHFPQDMASWWQSSTRDLAWWEAWFNRYQNFILNYADLAAKTHADALVIGGDWVTPALPSARLFDGSPSGVPGDVESRWRGLIAQVRARYPGKLIWAITFPDGVKQAPPFLDAVDQVYVLYGAALSEKNQPSEQDLQAALSSSLDQDLLPFYNRVQKPLILGIRYPSANGSASGCLPSPQGKCLSVSALDRPNPDIPSVTLDLQSQVDIYNAFMASVSPRNWISGFISRDFYPPVALEDKSASVHGKPAFNVLIYWFSKLGLNK